MHKKIQDLFLMFFLGTILAGAYYYYNSSNSNNNIRYIPNYQEEYTKEEEYRTNSNLDFYTTINYEYPEVVKKVEAGVEFKIHSIKIVNGDTYRILLENGEWIESKLKVYVKDGAETYVAELFKSCTSPLVNLKKKDNTVWIVDIDMYLNKTKVNLIDVLKTKEFDSLT